MEGGEVVVIGLARSGIAAAEFLARQGARVANVTGRAYLQSAKVAASTLASLSLTSP